MQSKSHNIKKDHKPVRTKVTVTDFSRKKMKYVFLVSFFGLIFLALFPYRGITREHGSYGLLFTYYAERFENKLLQSRGALPADQVSVPSSDRIARSVPTVMYHGVMSQPDSYNFSQDVFLDHMQTLFDAGWRTITLAEFRRFMAGEISVPEKSFLITFDDGRKDSYYPVDPLLERFGYSAVLFVLPQYSIDNEIISRYYLNREHLTDMISTDRWEIESHSWDAHSFFPLNADGSEEGIFFANLLWSSEKNRQETHDEFRFRVREDMLLADESMKRLTGNTITSIAFPFGNYGNSNSNFEEADDIVLEEARAVHDYGFVQTRSGLFVGHGFTSNYPSDDAFLINRIDVNPQWSGRQVERVLSGGLDKSLPFSATMSDFVGWIVPSGMMYYGDGGIFMETTTVSDRAYAFLDGGVHWQEYDASLSVSLPQNGTVTLSAYDRGAYEPYRCTFDSKRVSIEGSGISGLSGTSVEYDQLLSSSLQTIGIAVTDRTITCRIGGYTLYYEMPPEEQLKRKLPTDGTIGVALEASGDEPASLFISDLFVESLADF